MSIFENYEIFAISKRELNKLSDDTNHKIGSPEDMRKRVYFLLFSLFFIIYFAQYLKISLADIRYLLLWCVTYILVLFKHLIVFSYYHSLYFSEFRNIQCTTLLNPEDYKACNGTDHQKGYSFYSLMVIALVSQLLVPLLYSLKMLWYYHLFAWCLSIPFKVGMIHVLSRKGVGSNP